MPKKNPADVLRIRPDEVHADSEDAGMGARRWPDGEGGWNVHQLADHTMLPPEGEAGEWFQMDGHPGFQYRHLLCPCGYPQIEGRELPEAEAVIPPLATAANFATPTELAHLRGDAEA